MDDGIPFKAFLYMEEGAKAEVRRFSIDKMMYGKIKPLTGKVRDVFPKLRAKNFTLAWKDEDEDEVLMSSDEEVETMYQQSHDSVLKLIVRYTGPKTDEDTADEADVKTPSNHPESIHQGITCDGCGLGVVGFRYKCITCDDFDLCVCCEHDGKHSEHCVVRVPVPNMSLPLIKATIKKSRRFLKSIASQAHEESKRHRRERGTHHSSTKHGDGATAQGKQDSQKHGPRNWVSIFGSYLEEFTNLAGDLGRNADNKTEPGTSKPAENDTNIPTSDEISVNPWNLPQKDLEKLHHACKFMRDNALRSSVEPLTKAFSKVLAIAATAAEEATALSPARASSPVRAMTSPKLNKEASAPVQKEQPKHNVSVISPNVIHVRDIIQRTMEDVRKATITKKDTPKGGQEAPKCRQESPKGEKESPKGEQVSPKGNQTPKNEQEAPKKPEVPIDPVPSTSEENLVNVHTPSGTARVILPKEFTLRDMAELMDAVAAAKVETASNASTCSSSNGSVKAEEWTVIDNPNDDDAKTDLLTGQSDEAQNKVFDMLKPEGVEETRRIAPIYPPLNTATAVLDPKEADVAPAASAPEMPKPEVKPEAKPEAKPAPLPPCFKPMPGRLYPGILHRRSFPPSRPIDRSKLSPHILAAVEQMEIMGFSNQCDWLTQLLIHEDGNISAVLDLITPHTPRPK